MVDELNCQILSSMPSLVSRHTNLVVPMSYSNFAEPIKNVRLHPCQPSASTEVIDSLSLRYQPEVRKKFRETRWFHALATAASMNGGEFYEVEDWKGVAIW
jgi:hypothetical protein